MADLDPLLDPLLDLARKVATAGATLLAERVLGPPVSADSKRTATDLVTEVDRAAEQLVVGMLADARPDDGIVGEEGTSITGTSGVDWVIDPLDGTTNFVYRHPGFSVSIAALVDGEPCIGVIADPVHDDLFAARRGAGAERNGTRVHCSQVDDLGLALVATGFGYHPDERRDQARALATILPEVRDIRRMGGAALDLCSVACGRVDAYFERGLERWDMAAGIVIAAEAGARVGDLDGGPPSMSCCVAAPPPLFGPLTELLARSHQV